jgi:delta 1-pyrroline-5-carboxylate dehydrogenase
MLHKKSKVEFHPLGVIGAIVSWNYPFHNIFNPMLAAVFSGNSIVIKVSNVQLPNISFLCFGCLVLSQLDTATLFLFLYFVAFKF